MLRKRNRSRPAASSDSREPDDSSTSDLPTSEPAQAEATSEQNSPENRISFETGNPETGATITGHVVVRPSAGTSPTVLVESVPGLMTSANFCMFVRPFEDAIIHFRPLRLATERNLYVVVMQFRAPEDAANFAQVFEGKLFLRGLVQETCKIREVASMAFDTHSGPVDNADGNFPNTAMFPDDTPSDSQRTSCAVCLERLENHTTALVTTFCNHTMHAACLAQWDLNRCPVCRHTHELIPEASTCMHCDNREDLWMCVVCAYVGCGVYKNKHAHQHFAETQHPFSMNLEDCTFWSGEKIRAHSVWDYSSDRFVNRLLTSDDGKIVEVTHDARPGEGGSSSGDAATSACCGSTAAAAAADVVGDDDVENDRGLQAAVYASRMDAVVDNYRARLQRMEAEHEAEVDKLKAKMSRQKTEATESAKLRKALNRRVADAEKEAVTLRDKNGFLKSLNETLLRDKRGWNDEVENLKAKLRDSESERKELEEQLRDVMMHLETQSKISGASESCRSDASELVGGDVVSVGPSPRQRLAMKTNRRYSGD